MTLDVSKAIALAKDLLQTSGDFRPHNPALAAEFSDRAYEICNDLGIDHALLGVAATDDVVEPVDQDVEDAPSPTAAVGLDDEDTMETSQQLRELLDQQARVLKDVREADAAPKPRAKPKAKKRAFLLFGRQANDRVGQLQTA